MTSPLYEKVSHDPKLLPPYPPRRGRSRDTDGSPRNGVYIQTFLKTRVKRYIRNGHILAAFRYPNITQHFNSPFLNDYNQHLCGGWYWNFKENGEPRKKNEYNSDVTLERIIQKKKPLGSLVAWENEEEKMNIWLRNIKKHDLQARCSRRKQKYTFTVCSKGILGRLLDIDSLAADYITFDQKATRPVLGPASQVQSFFDGLRTAALEAYINFDYLRPNTVFDFITTGLILGYPIENTYALLAE